MLACNGIKSVPTIVCNLQVNAVYEYMQKIVQDMLNTILCTSPDNVAMSIKIIDACLAAASCAQDVMCGLKVESPMVLETDNKGWVCVFNHWSIARNTRAVSVWFAHIRESKKLEHHRSSGFHWKRISQRRINCNTATGSQFEGKRVR